MLTRFARRMSLPGAGRFERAAALALVLLFALSGEARAIPGGWFGVEVSPGPVPQPRQSHSLTSASAAEVILFGGVTSSGQLLSDTWVLQVPPLCGVPSTWTQAILNRNWPLPRKGHLAIHDTHRNEVVVFGGQGAGGLLNEAWAFSVANRTWRRINATNPPCVRTDAAGVYDPNHQRLVIFGGTGDEDLILRDTWALDLQTATWSLVFPNGPQCDVDCINCGSYPNPRTNATAIFDPQTSAMILHGGVSTGGLHQDDPWALDLGSSPSWAPLTMLGGSYVRSGHVAAYDPLAGRIVYQGGRDAQQVTATAFIMTRVSGSTWQREDIVAGVLPPAWEDHAGVWSSGQDRLFILNCTDPVPQLGNLWALSLDSTAPANIPDFTGELVYCQECFWPPILQTSAEVCWTAVGDDGLLGRPCVYEIRWNRHGPVTEMNWLSSLYAAPSLFNPSQGAGQQICTTAFPCGYNTFGYNGVWIAVRAYDESGNWSPVSNSVQFSNICQPTNALSVGEMQPAPALPMELRIGSQSPSRVEIYWQLGSEHEGRPFDLSVYDVAGRMVRRLAGGQAVAGTGKRVWDGGGENGIQGRGVFFVRLSCGNERKAIPVVMGRR